MPTHDEMIRTVERYIETFNRGDAAAVVALFAPQATLEDPIGSPAHRGHKAIRAFYEKAMAPGMKLKLDGPIRTTAEYAAFAFSVILDDDGRRRVDVIDTFRFGRDGKVAEMRAFFGPKNMHGFPDMQ